MSREYATDSTSFLRNINRVFDGINDKLEKPVREHLTAVYSTLCMGLAVAAVGASAHLFTEAFRAGFLLSLVSFGLMMALISIPATRENEKKRMGLYTAFCFTTGISLGPLLEMTLAIDPSIVSTALFATVIVFGSLSFASLHAESTKYIFMGGSLASASMTLLLVSLFFRWMIPSFLFIVAGLLIACGFVLYDTQLIIEKNRRGDHDYVWHSVELFIDFIQIFRYILVLLANKKDNERRRRRSE